MNNSTETNNQIDTLFHPESIAIVGLPRELKTGKLYLIALQDQGFSGQIVGVNPNADMIDGIKCYPSVASIPGKVDLAIVLTPYHQTLPVIEECAQKGVKGAVLFTAGYKETGTEEGAARQAKIVAIARKSGMRLIGPNGMGLYAPDSGLSFFPKLSRQSGPISLISHSGSLANIICGIGSTKGLFFNKAVSLGNECDLTSADFFTFFAEDPETKVISAYIEGISDGTILIRALKSAAQKKPVIIWKVGLNTEGLAAANSHTGALSSSKEIWEGVVAQCGITAVSGIEMWIDTMIGFSLLPRPEGNRVAIISGPGGFGVAAAEACGQENLQLAQISSETRSVLEKVVPPTGTSLRNPIDVGMTASLVIDIYIEAIKAVAADPNVDVVLIIGIGMTVESNQRFAEAVIDEQHRSGKPFLIVEVPNIETDFSAVFAKAGIPFFKSSERALATYTRVLKYYQEH
ncbi:MAG: CoA-binding protein [bacterium]